eukprot:5668107-Pyramimonas_sp.AAC.1
MGMRGGARRGPQTPKPLASNAASNLPIRLKLNRVSLVRKPRAGREGGAGREEGGAGRHARRAAGTSHPSDRVLGRGRSRAEVAPLLGRLDRGDGGEGASDPELVAVVGFGS